MLDFITHRPIDRHFIVNGRPSRHGRFGPAAPFRLSLEHKRDMLKGRAHKEPYSTSSRQAGRFRAKYKWIVDPGHINSIGMYHATR